MTNWARRERQWLCELFDEVGPDAPTLCGEWTTRQLAAHLVLRERRPDAALGVVVGLGPLQRHTDAVQRRLADKPWTELVGMVRSGPPAWSPTSIGPIDEAANTVEFFVHHEDVRRAAPGWVPRLLDPAEDEVLSRAAKRLKMLIRRSPFGLELRRPDGTVLLRKAGERTVTVEGNLGELILFAFGRQAHSDVRYQGVETDIAAVKAASFGI